MRLSQILHRLRHIPQDPRHHPEGDVLTHTAIVVRQAKFHSERHMRIDGLVAGIFHDTGKLTTTVVHDDGRITAHGHEKESVRILDQFVHLFPSCRPDVVRFIVRNHMRIKRLDEMRPAKVQRMMDEAADIDARLGLPTTSTFGLLRTFALADNAHEQARRFFRTDEERARRRKGFETFINAELIRREVLSSH